MATIFITGSTDGLGRDAARRLVDADHRVVGHARNHAKADLLRREVPGIDNVLVADLTSAGQVRQLADAANALGVFDAVIQNAGIGGYEPQRIETEDGHAHVLAVNVLAPYLLTAWMYPPGRITYTTSGLMDGATTDLSDLDWTRRTWNGMQAYSESKLYDATLAAALAHRWPEVVATSVSPGWVPTRMGGAEAPDDLDAGSATQAWLAVSEDDAARRSGAMFYHRQEVLQRSTGARALHPAVRSLPFQDALLGALADTTGVELPAADEGVNA